VGLPEPVVPHHLRHPRPRQTSAFRGRFTCWKSPNPWFRFPFPSRFPGTESTSLRLGDHKAPLAALPVGWGREAWVLEAWVLGAWDLGAWDPAEWGQGVWVRVAWGREECPEECLGLLVEVKPTRTN
jgi:hypothetical protein